MDMVKYSLILVLVCLLAACDAFQSSAHQQITDLPVVTVGATPPVGKDYVVLIPSGTTVPVELNLDGSLLTKAVSTKTHLTLVRDLYVYQHWSSHDGKNWQRADELLDVEVGGGFDIRGLSAHIRMDAGGQGKGR